MLYYLCMAQDESCLFCKIVAGKEPSVKVWENVGFLAIKNKYPVAKVHILVLSKEHVSKRMLASAPLRQGFGGAEMTRSRFWSKIMEAVFIVVRLNGLDKSGYKLVNNGAGYNHFDHEHIHVLGGTKEEPAGKT